MRPGTIIAALVTLQVAACAPAAVPGPMGDTRSERMSWVRLHAPEDARWMLLTFSDTSAIYLSRGINRERAPSIAFNVKYENYEPATADGHPFRSSVARFQGDCVAMRHRIVDVLAYADLNLKGERFVAANPLPAWSEPQIGSDGYRFLAMACLLSRPQSHPTDDPRIVGLDAPIYSADQVAARVWVDQNRLAQPPWTFLGADTRSASFLSDTDFAFTDYPRIRYWTKRDFFPTSTDTGSAVAYVEAECDQNRHRVISGGVYGALNLTGALVAQTGPSAWITNDATHAGPLHRVAACGVAQELKRRFPNGGLPPGDPF